MRTAAVKGEMNMAQKVQKVRSKLEKKGYKLEVKVLDWTEQNDAVANGD